MAVAYNTAERVRHFTLDYVTALTNPHCATLRDDTI